MESQNIEFRAVIITKEGAKAKEIHWRTADVYGDSSPKYSTVAKWSAEFKRGRDSLEDDPRPGRPADVISQEIIDWLTVGQGLLSLQQVRVESECFYFLFLHLIHFSLSPLSFSFISSTICSISLLPFSGKK